MWHRSHSTRSPWTGAARPRRRTNAAALLDRVADEIDRHASGARGGTRPAPAPPAAAGHAALASDPPQAGRRKGRRKRDEELTPEQRTYRDAQRVVNRKLGFIAHLVPYAMTCLFLLFVAGFRPAMIVALSWGIGIACHWFAVVAPTLRRQMVQREVGRRLDQTVSQERRTLGEQHARTLEELSASIAHEIRNPITAAKSLLQQMGEDPTSPDSVEYARVALEELDRVERSVSHLLRYAREEDAEFGPMRMSDAIDAALESFQDRIARSGIEVRRELDADGEMLGDVDKVRRILINLVGNALDALEQSRSANPRVEILAGEDLSGRQVWVRVRDNGPGIEGERLSKIFRPFYTSKEGGTGLGLSITKKLVDAHGGSIEAHSAPSKGTEFVLTFPRHGGAAGSAGPEGRP